MITIQFFIVFEFQSINETTTNLATRVRAAGAAEEGVPTQGAHFQAAGTGHRGL